MIKWSTANTSEHFPLQIPISSSFKYNILRKILTFRQTDTEIKPSVRRSFIFIITSEPGLTTLIIFQHIVHVKSTNIPRFWKKLSKLRDSQKDHISTVSPSSIFTRDSNWYKMLLLVQYFGYYDNQTEDT